jgi:hypothetical protein
MTGQDEVIMKMIMVVILKKERLRRETRKKTEEVKIEVFSRE